MKRLLLLFLPILVLLSFNRGNTIKHQCLVNGLQVHYETTQGRLNGEYTSFYPNGNKKAQGRFENNYRTGKWTVWDSTGQMRMQRVYSTPFNFKRTYARTAKDKVIKLLNVSPYELVYNEDGYINYFYLPERSIIVAKRIWRRLEPEENPNLFENDLLYVTIQAGIDNNKITVYSSSDDEFRHPATTSELQKKHGKIIGYKIKEDHIFDNERLVSEFRIIGICPVAIDESGLGTTDLYWLYYPELRSCLAQVKLTDLKLSKNIDTLDDLFFYRHFHGNIYKEANVNDLSIDQYKSGEDIIKEAEKIEINLIESEHDVWISLTNISKSYYLKF